MRATLDTEQLVLVPEQPAKVVVSFTNGLEVIDGITATLSGGDGLGVSCDPAILLLFPDGSGIITLTLTASATFAAGIHQTVVEVRSRVDPEVLRLPLQLEVTPAPAASLIVDPPTRSGRSSGSYTIICDNTGNTPIELSLAASDPVRALTPDFASPLLRVESGSVVSTQMTVTTRRHWFGGDTRRQINVVGTSNDLELESQAAFTQRPVISRGVRTALVLGAVVAVWAVIFVFALNRALAKDPLTKEVPASFYAADVHMVPGSAVSVSALHADLVGLTSTGSTSDDAPPGAVPKSGVVIGVGGTINGRVDALSTKSGIGRITVQAIRNSPSGEVLVASAASASDGTYSIPGLLPGEYKLRFSAQGYTNVWWPEATSSSAARPIPVAATLQTSGVDTTITGLDGSINGSIDTGQTPAPPVQVTVTQEQTASGSGHAFTTMATSNAQGTYTVSNLPAPGTYDLSFTSGGYLVASDVEQVAAGGSQAANTITLSASNGTLGGTVTDGTNPLGGVTITASANGKTVTSATPTSGAVGQFTIPNLATPSTYLLTLTKPGFGTQTIAVNLGPGQADTNLSIAMQGGAGQISGTVSGPSGQPLGGVTVSVDGPSGTASTQTLTAGAVGTYLVAGLATPGSYTVTFSLSGYSSETVAANLSSSGSANGVNVTLPVEVGTITGTVVSASGNTPLSGVQVTITDGVNIATTQTSSSPPGGFTVSGLAPVSYAVTFSLAGYQSETALVQLSPGASKTLAITLQADG